MLAIIIFLVAVSVTAIIFFIIKKIELEKNQEDYKLIIRQYKKMSELNHKKKALIGIVSHDVSTPLASIDMWGELLKSSEGNLDAQQKKSIDMIQEAAHYGQKLIRKIVELENVIPEKLAIEDFNFGILVNSIVENFELSIKTNVRFVLNIDKEVFLLSDKTMIKKMCAAVLSDSISNAKNNSELQVSLRNEKDEIIFQVEYDAVDNAKNKLSGLFSDYKQISSSKDETLEISNLAIAHRIVEELNGEIFSENNEIGNSIITVKFKSN